MGHGNNRSLVAARGNNKLRRQRLRLRQEMRDRTGEKRGMGEEYAYYAYYSVERERERERHGTLANRRAETRDERRETKKKSETTRSRTTTAASDGGASVSGPGTWNQPAGWWWCWWCWWCVLDTLRWAGAGGGDGQPGAGRTGNWEKNGHGGKCTMGWFSYFFGSRCKRRCGSRKSVTHACCVGSSHCQLIKTAGD